MPFAFRPTVWAGAACAVHGAGRRPGRDRRWLAHGCERVQVRRGARSRGGRAVRTSYPDRVRPLPCGLRKVCEVDAGWSIAFRTDCRSQPRTRRVARRPRVSRSRGAGGRTRIDRRGHRTQEARRIQDVSCLVSAARAPGPDSRSSISRGSALHVSPDPVYWASAVLGEGPVLFAASQHALVAQAAAHALPLSGSLAAASCDAPVRSFMFISHLDALA